MKTEDKILISLPFILILSILGVIIWACFQPHYPAYKCVNGVLYERLGGSLENMYETKGNKCLQHDEIDTKK